MVHSENLDFGIELTKMDGVWLCYVGGENFLKTTVKLSKENDIRNRLLFGISPLLLATLDKY